MTPPNVSADARYLGSWNEINARIAQRQALITIYTSLALAALGTPLLLGTGGLWRLSYAIGPLSILFAMLLRMHERMIQILADFLAELEGPETAEALPRYYASDKWARPVAHTRRIHDWVCFFLVLGINGAACSVLFFGPHVSELTSGDEVCAGVMALTTGLSLWLIFRIAKSNLLLAISERGL